jgi:hypothetical protein
MPMLELKRVEVSMPIIKKTKISSNFENQNNLTFLLKSFKKTQANKENKNKKITNCIVKPLW